MSGTSWKFRIATTLFALLAILVALSIDYYRIPELDQDEYWGPGLKKSYTPDYKIHRFRIENSTQQINDLQLKLQADITFTSPFGDNESSRLPSMMEYWRDMYLSTWEKHLTLMNAFPQYTTEVQGLRIHYIHIKPSRGMNDKLVLPLLLLHGWPSSVREFFDLIPHLTAPNDEVYYNFEIVVPSLPGTGWSDATAKPGLDMSKMAMILMNLMYRLGCSQFMVHGSGVGGVLGSHLGTLFPNNVRALHSTMCVTNSWKAALKWTVAIVYPAMFIPSEFVAYAFPIRSKLSRLLSDSSHMQLLATQPEIIAAMVSAHPVALAAFILSAFEQLTPDVDEDALLDNVMIYYLNGNLATSAQFVAAEFAADTDVLAKPTDVPTGCTRFRADAFHMFDWQLHGKYTKLIHSSYHPSGGHHAAFTAADILYRDFVLFVKKYVGSIDWNAIFEQQARVRVVSK